ncbi:uroporphyrinogen-III synthase [Enemella evansiae]|uniref:uroporphyrinogen-III synthase n=1 Tax=Enemella evansiae TaxID=2016499 RepID=UPI000B97B13D|nr:uroporphyrinogen-III synthase [Enemella evansiae]OYO00091.1 uroporphyrinogen-III synthase [Enemella evansiae]
MNAELTGFTIAVTSDRRSADLLTAFERRGARVCHLPLLRTAPAEHDEVLLAETRAIIAARPDAVIVTTAYGLRRWTEAADAAGLLDDLLAALWNAELLIRGPKARGAVRAAGLDDAEAHFGDLTGDLVDRLITDGVDGTPLAGSTVAIQLHGYADHSQLDRLRDAGATVLSVEPYRWLPGDAAHADRLVTGVCDGELDVLTFTSAPAVDALLDHARAHPRGAEFFAALREGETTAAAIGPVTAQGLIAAGIEPVVPERYRLGALVRAVTEHLTAHRRRSVPTALGELEIRGHAARIGTQTVPLSPVSLRLLTRLADSPGRVVPREELAGLLPTGASDHALDVAISRLRGALPDNLVRTVVRRGYLLQR